MKLVIETYTSVIVICVCVLLCACLMSIDLGAAGARDAYTTYVSELQDSNFADSVVEACKTDASNRGYTVNITTFEDSEGNRSGTVELQYTYEIKMIGYSTQKHIRGYAS